MAAAIFAATFVMLMAVFPTAARAVRQGEEYLVGTFLAERRLEEIRAMPYDNLVSDYTTVAVASTQTGIQQSTTYGVQTEVTDQSPGLKRVRILVSWTRDRARHVEVLTDVTDVH